LPVDDIDWSDQADEIIDGCLRYMGRVWRLATGDVGAQGEAGGPTLSADELRREVHRTTDRISVDIERYGFNTCVAALMELTNTIYKHVHAGTDTAAVGEAIDTLLELLAPFAPHLAAEAYDARHSEHVHLRPWPAADPAYLKADRVTLVVQVNGKLRDRLDVDADISEDEAVALALASPKVQQALGGAEPRRVIARPPNLVNIVA
jgi:leucyl-tRNA synthetase